MPKVRSQVRPQLNRAFRADPARIGAIQRRMEADLVGRLRSLEVAVEKSIVDLDCFGIVREVDRRNALRVLDDIMTPTGRWAYDFKTTQTKVDGFMGWLREQQDRGFLQLVDRPGVVVSGTSASWSGTFVESSYVKNLRDAYLQGIQRAGSELSRAGYPSLIGPAGISMAFQQPFHVERVGLIYSRTYEELKTALAITDTQARQAVVDGLTTGLARGMAEGKNGNQIARGLASDVIARIDAVAVNRTRMIARTEVSRAHHQATIAEYRQAEVEGVDVEAEWETSGLDNVCDECNDMADGGPYTLDEIEDMIPAHPQCCIAETLVIAPGVLGAIRTWYEGPIVEMTFSDGTRLSVTPNHMLLTPSGFARTDDLREGDDVLCRAPTNRESSCAPHDHWKPVAIGQVFESFLKSGTVSTRRMPVAPEDLHGDALFAKGEVDVVRTNGLLRDNGEAGAAEICSEPLLAGVERCAEFLGRCDLAAMLEGLSLATDCGVGGERAKSALLWGKRRHMQGHGLAHGPTRNTLLSQTTVNHDAFHAETFSNALDRLSTGVSADDVVNVQLVSIVGSGDPQPVKPSVDRLSGNAQKIGQVCGGFSRLVTMRKVIKINRREFSGHVFDLQTQSTLYICGGAVSSNCACVAKPLVKGVKGRPVDELIKEGESMLAPGGKYEEAGAILRGEK